MCSVTVAVQTKGLEINACKKWGEGTLRNLFVLLCLLCTLPKPESWPIKYKIIYYINYTWEPFSLVMPTVGVHPSLKPDSRLAEEAAAVCVWVWLSVCGWISTAQPCYSPCGPGPQAGENLLRIPHPDGRQIYDPRVEPRCLSSRRRPVFRERKKEREPEIPVLECFLISAVIHASVWFNIFNLRCALSDTFMPGCQPKLFPLCQSGKLLLPESGFVIQLLDNLLVQVEPD